MKKLILIIIMFSAMMVFPSGEDTVEAVIVDYNVYVHSEKIDVTHSQYPVLNYNGVTYLPLTYDILSAFGLELDYYYENGFEIKPLTHKKAYEQLFISTTVNTLGKKVYPTVYTLPAVFNGQTYDEAAYPVLSYNEIMYIPMTWTFTQDIFDIPLTWAQNDGLYLGQDENKIVQELGVLPKGAYAFKIAFDRYNPVGNDWSVLMYYDGKQLSGLEVPIQAINEIVTFDVTVVESDAAQPDYGYAKVEVPYYVFINRSYQKYEIDITVEEDNNSLRGKSTVVKFTLELFKNVN